MITMIAAALAAAAPAAPAAVPADVHAQHQQAQQGGQQHEAMKDECCCKEMMEKMHSEMNRTQDHQDHNGH